MKTFFKENISKIILIFLILQPILDCITSITLNVFNYSLTIGMIIRMLFLLLLMFYNFIITKPNKKNIILSSLTIIYVIAFSSNVILTKDTSVFFYELKNLVRYLYFPILLWNLYELKTKEKLEIPEKTLNKTYLIYIALILIPMITNTSFSGYTQGKIGTIGWFSSTNEIGAILSSLLPYLLLSKKVKIFIPLFIITTIIFFSLGSKITCLSLVIVFVIYILKQIKKSKNRKKLITFLIPTGIIILVAGALLLPKTAFYKNIETHLEFLGLNSIMDIFKDKDTIDHFIFSSRLSFLSTTSTNYQNAPLTTKLIGLGFIENYKTDNVNLKTIEMDPFDIFFRTGIIGTLLILLPIIFLIKDYKYKSSIKKNTSLGLFILISILAGHVFTSPAVSIYPALILLDYIKEEDE